MTTNSRSAFYRMAAPLTVLASATLIAWTAGATGTTQTNASTACEIVTSKTSGMTIIEGVVTSGKAISGTYSLRVSGSGTNIRQGGDFDAAPNEKTALGKVSLGGSASDYDIDLKVETGGRTVPCNTRA